MAEIDIKWYTPIELLFGAVTSFADPITDILTLLEFYRTDHKTWFYVGLTFVILPCLVFPLLYFAVRNETLSEYSGTRKCWQTLLCGFHPFSAAFARLEEFVYCSKKWLKSRREDVEEPARYVLDKYIDLAAVFESVLESAPQFILQVYAIHFQDQEPQDFQVISLCISLFSLVWAFTIVDKFLYEEVVGEGNLSLKQRVYLFIGHLFSLGTRLAAIYYFTLLFKWWIVVVMLSHTFVMLTIDIILCCKNSDCKCEHGFIAVFVCCLYWLRDDVSLQIVSSEDFDRKKLRKWQVLCSVLFALENTGMLLTEVLYNNSNNIYYTPPVLKDMSVKDSVLAAFGMLFGMSAYVWIRFKLLSYVYDDD